MAPITIDSLRINDGIVRLNSTQILHLPGGSVEDMYRALHCNYPKFFKMDLLCKWAWLGAEILLQRADSTLYDGKDKNKIGVVLATRNGCLQADKKYQQTLNSIPSPALFVYTLPNIMLGEICIRHGFKGEQLCLVQDSFKEEEISFWVNDLLVQRGMEHCLVGWIDAVEDKYDVCLFWAAKDGVVMTPAMMEEVYAA